MGLSRTGYEINGDSVENRNFSYRRVFSAPGDEVPLKFFNSGGLKRLE